MQPTSKVLSPNRDAFRVGSTQLAIRMFLGRPNAVMPFRVSLGKIIPAETRALYSWDEGRSFVHAWSGTFGEPESAVVPTAPPISGR